MALNNKPISSVEQADLAELISSQEAEGKTLEFKSELFGGADDEKKEFLADISSFANAFGGFIIYGMEEVQGIASALHGISGLDPDKEKQRIENIIRDGIAPRIIGIAIHPVNLNNGNYAIVIHIPKSWASPHMVTYKGTSRFFTRNSSGKYQMDVHEIRQAFLVSESVSEKIRNFRLDRLSHIGALETPVPMNEGAKIVLHSIPLTAFQSIAPVNISDAPKANIHDLIPHSNSFRFNLDGVVFYAQMDQSMGAFYAQLFRNGVVEYVDNYLMHIRNTEKATIPVYFELEVTKSCQNILQFQEKIGVEPPILIFLTLV